MSLAVDNLIVNSPFGEPTRYRDYKEAQPVLAEGRRPAGYYLRPSTQGSHAALGFLDTRYVGMTFHICQALFLAISMPGVNSSGRVNPRLTHGPLSRCTAFLLSFQSRRVPADRGEGD